MGGLLYGSRATTKEDKGVRRPVLGVGADDIQAVFPGTNRDIAASLDSEADKLADEAVTRVQAGRVGILDQLTLRLVILIECSSRQRPATWRIRSIVGTAAVALLALAVARGYV